MVMDRSRRRSVSAKSLLLLILWLIAATLNQHTATTTGDCIPLNYPCPILSLDGERCCSGYCRDNDLSGSPLDGVCACTHDGTLPCTSNSQCCSGFCNSRKYCGCIGYDGICNRDSDCCNGSCNLGCGFWCAFYSYCN